MDDPITSLVISPGPDRTRGISHPPLRLLWRGAQHCPLTFRSPFPNNRSAPIIISWSHRGALCRTRGRYDQKRWTLRVHVMRYESKTWRPVSWWWEVKPLTYCTMLRHCLLLFFCFMLRLLASLLVTKTPLNFQLSHRAQCQIQGHFFLFILGIFCLYNLKLRLSFLHTEQNTLQRCGEEIAIDIFSIFSESKK